MPNRRHFVKLSGLRSRLQQAEEVGLAQWRLFFTGVWNRFLIPAMTSPTFMTYTGLNSCGRSTVKLCLSAAPVKAGVTLQDKSEIINIATC